VEFSRAGASVVILLIPDRWAFGADAEAPADVESKWSDGAPAPVNEPEKADLAEPEATARTRSLRRRAGLSFAPRIEHAGATLTLSGRF
jgi:hypothetical protein